MDKNMVINENRNNQIHPFQVRYMSNTGFNSNKAFREQDESNMDFKFDSKTMFSIRKLLRKDNICVISLTVFYENRNNLVLRY